MKAEDLTDDYFESDTGHFEQIRLKKKKQKILWMPTILPNYRAQRAKWAVQNAEFQLFEEKTSNL